MEVKRLYRSRTDRVIGGISGGAADYFNVDPTVIRAGWVIAAILSGGLAVVAYIILVLVIPVESKNILKKAKNNS